MLEKRVVETCCRDVLERSVGEECCREVLVNSIVREGLEDSGAEKSWRSVL